MPFCTIHNHIYRQACGQCDRSDRAKRGYKKANPYSRGSHKVELPDYSVIPTMEELASIPPSEWTEKEYQAKRIHLAGGTKWNNGCEIGL